MADRGRDHRAEQRTLSWVGERALHQARVRPQVTEQRAGLGPRQRPLGHLYEHVGDQGTHRPPSAIDRGLADTGTSGHVGELETVEPALHQSVTAGADHGVTDPGGPPTRADSAGNLARLRHKWDSSFVYCRSMLPFER